MRFATLFTTAVAVTGVAAAPFNLGQLWNLLTNDLSANNHYGAPHPPWEHGSRPGWYLGDHGDRFPNLACLRGFLCRILEQYPHFVQCPKPPPPAPTDGYHQTFSNLTGAIQAPGYLTFGLVDTVAQCKTMCDSVTGCTFANTYHDVNGKDGSTQLTCSLYSECHNADEATNMGGQTQPDGTVDYITDSDGWCKS